MGLGTIAYFAFGGLFTATFSNALRQMPLLRGATLKFASRGCRQALQKQFEIN